PIRFLYQVEARYRGQEHGVFVGFSAGDTVESFSERLHAAHERAYAFRLTTTPVEITTMHLEAVLEGPVITLPVQSPAGRTLDAAVKGERRVYFGKETGWLPCPVYDRLALPIAQDILGPLLVEEATTTSLVQPGQLLSLTENGIMVIREAGRGAR
ncbi:MAG: hydantoinase/oxoprolinase family protein, partial [Pararhizobium sp.]